MKTWVTNVGFDSMKQSRLYLSAATSYASWALAQGLALDAEVLLSDQAINGAVSEYKQARGGPLNDPDSASLEPSGLRSGPARCATSHPGVILHCMGATPSGAGTSPGGSYRGHLHQRGPLDRAHRGRAGGLRGYMNPAKMATAPKRELQARRAARQTGQ